MAKITKPKKSFQPPSNNYRNIGRRTGNPPVKPVRSGRNTSKR